MTAILYGLQVAAVGILVVFAGLCILIGCIKVMQMVLGKFVTPKAPAQQAAPAPAPVSVQEPEEDEADEGELIAVISAAVAAMLASQTEQSDEQEEASGFVVRAIRRVGNAPAWNRAGREEQVYSRL